MSGTHPTLIWPDRDDHRLRRPTARISDDLASARIERSNIEAPPRLLAIGCLSWPALRQSSSANDHPQECGEADMLEYRPRRTSSAEGSRQSQPTLGPCPKLSTSRAGYPRACAFIISKMDLIVAAIAPPDHHKLPARELWQAAPSRRAETIVSASRHELDGIGSRCQPAPPLPIRDPHPEPEMSCPFRIGFAPTGMIAPPGENGRAIHENCQTRPSCGHDWCHRLGRSAGRCTATAQGEDLQDPHPASSPRTALHLGRSSLSIGAREPMACALPHGEFLCVRHFSR